MNQQTQDMTADTVITGAQVLLEDGLQDVSVTVSGGKIVEIGTDRPASHRIDGRGLILAPALVDIHGDGFERQLMPRPKVFFPTDTAILETDRQLAGNGIGTAYHALTLSWEPGLRAIDRGAEYMAAQDRLEPRLTVDNRIQLRWETFAFEALDLIAERLQGPKRPSIAFNDHTTMAMRAFDIDVTDRPFELSEAEIAPLSDARMKQRCAGNAKRAGISEDEYIALLSKVWDRRDRVDDTIRQVAALGRDADSPMLSHDDSQLEMRDYFAGLGVNIAEFPMCDATAQAAKARGEWVVLGSPNAVRGGSHIGSLHAADMVEDGVCDILASDYYHPAMLAAAARLMDEKRGSLARIWATISANPAKASGLTDRGEIATGKRADLVLVEWPEGGTPAIRMTMSAGHIAYYAGATP
ncbi:alpha-D-ribose 1-methylphosphonate 5-triphosphate diphosphatase [Halovulum sp. GXIMD14793]